MVKRSKHPKRIVALVLSLVCCLTFTAGVIAFSPQPAFAADEDPAKDNICKDTNNDKVVDQKEMEAQKPCLLKSDLKSTPDPAAKTCQGGDCSGLITKYVNPLIKLLTGLIGVIVVTSIVVGGIQYSAAGGDPSKVAAAKKRIYNAIVALLAYLFMFAFLQWLIPGGIV